MGVTSGVTVSSGSELTLGTFFGVTFSHPFGEGVPGGPASDIVINSGGLVSVAFGGSTSGVMINDGGLEALGPGGEAVGITVSSGGTVATSGTVDLFSRPIAASLSDTVLLSGGLAMIGPDSMLAGVVVSSGGVEIINPSATASGSTIETGGILFVQPGGGADGATVEPGAAVVSGGVVLIQPTIGATTFPGSASGLTIGSGASEYAFVNGTALDTTVSDGGSMNVWSGGMASSTTLTSSGFEHVSGGGSAVDTTVSGGSTLDAVNGGLLSDTVLLAGGIEHVLAGGSAVGTTVSSGGAEGIYPGGSAVGTTIENGGQQVLLSGAIATDLFLQPGGTIYLAYLSATADGTATLDPATDMLHVSVGGQTTDLQLAGDYSGKTFSVMSNTDQLEFVTVACFVTGTHILTTSGEVPVEQLRVGDRVATTAGMLVRLIWIGHQRTAGRPVWVSAGAFGATMPARDLLLSPDHAVFVDGALVPVRHLINGSTIVQEQVDEVTYYHVELAAHDVILAEGLPCESYLDTGNRAAFDVGETAFKAATKEGKQQVSSL